MNGNQRLSLTHLLGRCALEVPMIANLHLQHLHIDRFPHTQFWKAVRYRIRHTSKNLWNISTCKLFSRRHAIEHQATIWVFVYAPLLRLAPCTSLLLLCSCFPYYQPHIAALICSSLPVYQFDTFADTRDSFHLQVGRCRGAVPSA